MYIVALTTKNDKLKFKQVCMKINNAQMHHMDMDKPLASSTHAIKFKKVYIKSNSQLVLL